MVWLTCHNGPENLFWQAHIIERFRKKHQLIDIILFDGHPPIGNLPVSRRPSPSVVDGRNGIWCSGTDAKSFNDHFCLKNPYGSIIGPTTEIYVTMVFRFIVHVRLTDEIHRHVGTDDIHRHIGLTDEIHRHVGTDDIHRHVRLTDEIHRHIGTDDIHQHVGTDEIHRHVGTEEIHRHVGTDDISRMRAIVVERNLVPVAWQPGCIMMTSPRKFI